MKQKTKINTHMFNLLIKKEMNAFSVTEARDALMATTSEFKNHEEARRYVYRQIWTYERKGWLISKVLSGVKRYTKTESFLSHSFTPRDKKELSKPRKVSALESTTDLKTLVEEKRRYEGELAIVLGEVEEYQSLIKRFPKEKALFLPMLTEAKEGSAKLLGSINALSKVLKASTFKVAA
ncbi:hypothetical protein LNL84_01835 [Vibrio sp. ZSDZ34]|uniref:Response regulator n=1 Tax=Vibrio gelatinilyticus TaxID=2893468 RepID=A0A9X1WEL2_9VIBR|nr:hypothetical protein [Vibrio gelatinilyticus]MCJ2375569.1 hypothetical protein [Vibrio gelatinilyticus]